MPQSIPSEGGVEPSTPVYFPPSGPTGNEIDMNPPSENFLALLADLGVFSWSFWLIWAGIGLGFELYAVRTEKKTGALPLTRVVRDRLMRRSKLFAVFMLAFLAWLFVHFVTPLDW